MIEATVQTSYDLDGWPREIIVLGDHQGGDCQVIRVPLDCPARPAGWEQVAQAFETAAKVIRRDCLPKEG